jgi:hypothetical protein
MAMAVSTAAGFKSANRIVQTMLPKNFNPIHDLVAITARSAVAPTCDLSTIALIFSDAPLWLLQGHPAFADARRRCMDNDIKKFSRIPMLRSFGNNSQVNRSFCSICLVGSKDRSKCF